MDRRLQIKVRSISVGCHIQIENKLTTWLDDTVQLYLTRTAIGQQEKYLSNQLVSHL
jgi:hypothetical protein